MSVTYFDVFWDRRVIKLGSRLFKPSEVEKLVWYKQLRIMAERCLIVAEQLRDCSRIDLWRGRVAEAQRNIDRLGVVCG